MDRQCFGRRNLRIRAGPVSAKGVCARPQARIGKVVCHGAGLYECSLNGHRVGDGVFTPGWTDYARRAQYQAYDVTALLREGDNALGAILGDGWYCGHMAERGRQQYGDRPKLLAQLEIVHADGSRDVVATDGSWKWDVGPILESDLYMGENYDARREFNRWNQPRFDDGAWQAARVFPDPEMVLAAQYSPPVRRTQELHPVADPVRVGTGHIYDLGQNMVGRARLTMSGPRGNTIRLRFAEMLNPDGTLYTDNLREARATDYYTFKGDGIEIYEPRFTFPGFRYVELSWCDRWYKQEPPPDAVTGVVLHSDISPTGSFECSHSLINQLQSNISWGQRGNFLEVPTDCPQRDERLGWTGDAQVFIRTAAFNRDVAAFFTKWQQHLADAQGPRGQFPMVAPKFEAQQLDGGPAWADAGIICPWTMYQCYGDLRLLEQHYDSLARFMEYQTATSRQFIRPWRDDPEVFTGFSDWMAVDASIPGRTGTPRQLIGTAYFFRCATLMSQIADCLGRAADARRYGELAANIKAAFNREFVTAGGRVAGHTQTGYLLALGFDLLPEEKRPLALAQLLDELQEHQWHLSTGFVGTPLLCPVLSRFGRSDVAYRILEQTSYPGWLFSVLQGATTMWERWNSWSKDKGFGPVDMNSFNHYAYGAIGEWLYATVGGIDLDPRQPGYKHIVIRPTPGGSLTHAKARLESLYGLIESHWRLQGEQFSMDIIVPPNSHATVHVPATGQEQVTESGKPAAESDGVAFVAMRDGAAVYQVGAGRYQFAAVYRQEGRA